MADSADTSEVSTKIVIGIAFGNTNSSIAYTSPDGKAEVIANEEGDRQIPSVLSYVGSEEFHGTQAKSQLVRNSSNTVAYFRDYIGKKYADIDPTHSHASAHPHNVDDYVSFNLKQGDDEAESAVSISEITSRHLRRLRDSATEFLGRPVQAAVITVPTDFTVAQRESLLASAKAVDLEVLQLIHEPVAAVIAYAAKEENVTVDKNIVVADFGGTRSDAAVITARGGMYTILATTHDYELGGAQLDEVLVDYFAKEFEKKNKVDPRKHARSLAKLKQEVEGTKKTLSLSTTAPISIDSLAEGHDFHFTINRSRYELLAKRVFDQMVRLVESVVAKAELDLLDIDEVILAGGASHTPKIANRLATIFSESTAILAPATSASSLNPSELTARGAAIQAQLIQNFDKEDIEQSTHPAVTVAPHLSKSIGVAIDAEGDGDTFYTLLQSDAALPARKTAQFHVGETGDVLVRICEGSREIVTTKAEKPNGVDEDKGEAGRQSDEEEDEDDEEETRHKVLKAERVIAECALKGAQKGQHVEVTINVAADLSMTVAARLVGVPGGVRGQVEPPKSE